MGKSYRRYAKLDRGVVKSGEGGNGAPEEIRTPDPRFVVWAGSLKSLKSVTVRKPLVVEIGVIRQLMDALRYRKSDVFPILNHSRETTLEHSIATLAGACVYRKSKSERIDDEVRPVWRANL